MSDLTGFKSVPAHYDNERETIDVIRDDLGDEDFCVWCIGNAIKYAARAGRKEGASAQDDEDKMRFYVRMACHVGPKVGPDPRASREGFTPYAPQFTHVGYAKTAVVKVLDAIADDCASLDGVGS